MDAGVDRTGGQVGDGSEPLSCRRREPVAVASFQVKSSERDSDWAQAARKVVAAAQATVTDMEIKFVLQGRT